MHTIIHVGLTLAWLVVTVPSAASRISEFIPVEPLNNTVCPIERRLFESHVASRLVCMAMAAERDDCAGVSYHDDNSTCYGCDTYLEVTGQFQALAGATLFKRLNVAPYSFVDVSGYILRIVDAQKTYDEAASACAAFGSLVRIDTPGKQNAIASFLMNNGYSGYIYRIQLRVFNDAWRYDDGTPVPMTSTYWAPWQPDFVPGGDCGHMNNLYQYKWDNLPCSDSGGYICELQ